MLVLLVLNDDIILNLTEQQHIKKQFTTFFKRFYLLMDFFQS